MADEAKPRVFVTRRLPAPIEARMRELFNVTLNAEDRPLDQGALARAVSETEILVPTVTDRIDRTVLDHAGPALRMIANFGNGVDHIDLEAARQKGLVVTNTPGVLTEDTADMTIALILAVTRRIFEGARLLAEGRWQGWSPTGLLGHRLAGRRLGILGMGRIGQAVARRARAFGLEIHYHSRRPVPEPVAAELEARFWDKLDAMLAAVDILSIHCPHTSETHHLLSAERLRLLPPQAILINTARGDIVDEEALIERLESGGLAGAGLDVYENEPRVDPRLPQLPNVVALPHMGSATEEARIAMGEKVLINIRSFVDGHTPPDRILNEWL
ncbi:MAG: D-glycerate dehydrogenase [Alphaproteobacteria bacterium]|nr:MAG: D-glycerate dehydrogenase [Alphaproteobacteria bacterium]